MITILQYFGVLECVDSFRSDTYCSAYDPVKRAVAKCVWEMATIAHKPRERRSCTKQRRQMTNSSLLVAYQGDELRSLFAVQFVTIGLYAAWTVFWIMDQFDAPSLEFGGLLVATVLGHIAERCHKAV